MKAISLRQPWLWIVVHLDKCIENRRWNTHYRGFVLLHASSACSRLEYSEAVEWVRLTISPDLAMKIPPRVELPFGGICGRAEIVDVLPPRLGRPSKGEGEAPYPAGVDGRWHMPEQYGFILANVVQTPFVPCKGALSLFDLDEDVVRRCAA